MTSGTMRRRRRRRKRRNEAVRQSSKCVFHDVVPGVLAGPVIFTGPFFVSEKGVEGGLFSDSMRVCNFLWAARSRLIDVGGDSVTK